MDGVASAGVTRTQALSDVDQLTAAIRSIVKG